MQAANTGAAAATSSLGAEAAAPLRACSTSGCRVSKYVEVTKRKCSQFVVAPYIMPKPLVVNGKTSIFQVGGEMARLCNIPSLAAAVGGNDGQPVYRIKPGTHAHVINYVFIDEGSDSMEKAKAEDQETMRLLLDSQRESAAAKLQKLIVTHRGVPQTAGTDVSSTATATATATVSASSSTPTAVVQATPTVTTTSASANINPTLVTTPQIHPNLSIASVAGAQTLTTAPAVAAPQPATPAPQSAKKPADNSVDHLQAEILKMRRKVARLGASARR